MGGSERSPGLRDMKTARREMYRRQVLAAAEYEFSRAGFGEAKMTSIARTADVSLATVYKNFTGKSEVWEALHADRMGDLLAFVEASIKTIASPLDRLLQGARSTAIFLAEHPAYLELNLKEGLGWGANDVAEIAHGNQRTAWTSGLETITLGVIDAVKAGQLPALRPRVAAGMIISALQVWLYDWVKSEHDRSPTEVADEMVHYLRRMLGADDRQVQPQSSTSGP